tara:strand:- start:371 stop:628 length:258 start_codon:yes stop_codon:yes gene_type:complete
MKKTLKALYLDKPTSHGGWPDGHSGSYTDQKTPVNKQISDYLESMGLLDDSNPNAKLSENQLSRRELAELIKEVLLKKFGFSNER